MQLRAHVYPQGSPTRLRHISFRGTCLKNTCFMFFLFFSTCLPTRALGTRVLCLFCLSTNTRSFYFSEYEILTAELVNPKYWNHSWLAPFLGHDSTRNHPPKMPNSQHLHVTNIPRHTDCLSPLIPIIALIPHLCSQPQPCDTNKLYTFIPLEHNGSHKKLCQNVHRWSCVMD